MSRARPRRVPQAARRALALLGALGSIACAGGFASTDRSGQAGPGQGQIDLTSPGGPAWPQEEPAAPERELSDADVEQIATRLPRERVPQVTPDNPSKGPATAAVTLQIFSDFECPFCVRVAPTLARVEARFHGRVRLVWRNYPLPGHERARPAARAVLAAFALGGSPTFWKLHDKLYAADADLSDVGLRQSATQVGLDAARFEQAFTSPRYELQVNADMAAGDAAGIEGTPAVFVNDYYLMGARSEAEYAIVIERALRERSG